MEQKNENKQPIEQEGICTHGTEREVMRCGPTLEIQINYLQFVYLVIRFCWSYYCLKIQGNSFAISKYACFTLIACPLNHTYTNHEA